MTVTLEERMSSKYSIDAESGCWRWTAWVGGQGYGLIYMAGRGSSEAVGAHRAMYEVHRGPIPEGLALDHLCHNRDTSCRGGKTCLHRRCVNPDHLEPVPSAVNTARGRAGEINRERLSSRTHCTHGHEFTAENVRFDSRGRRACRACGRERMRSRAGTPQQRRSRGPRRDVVKREGKTAWLACGHVIEVSNPHRPKRHTCFVCEQEIQAARPEGDR